MANAGTQTAGRFSLRRQLFIWLTVPLLVLWVASAFFAYRLALDYAAREIDASLSTATRALARRIQPLESGLLIDFPTAAQDILQSDFADRLWYMVSSPPGKFILGNPRLPGIPLMDSPPWGEPIFFDGELEEESGNRIRVRQAALFVKMGSGFGDTQPMLIQVAKSSANREVLARQIFRDMALPLSLLGAVLGGIVWIGIRAGLSPLSLLRQQVDARDPDDLNPIPLDTAPVEVRGLGEAINALLLKMRLSMEVQRRFIDDAAHQLRTPLAGLKSQTELALVEVRDPDTRARLEKVHESAVRGAHLVGQLLMLARSGPEGVETLPIETFNLPLLVRELTLSSVSRAIAAGIDLGYEGPAKGDEMILVAGRPSLLREALQNLIDNAIKYAGKGCTVTVRVYRKSNAEVCCEVEDNGPGIAVEDRERVFERFYRGSSDVAGCGIGLSIVKEIVQRHSGQISMQSAEPHGLRVKICLPTGLHANDVRPGSKFGGSAREHVM